MIKFVAVVLTALLIEVGATAPTQSQALNFGIFFGDEPSDFYDEPILCLTDSQVRRTVEDQGYTNVALNVPNDKHVQVRATRNGALYLLDFNYCTGEIERRQRLRAAD